MNVEEIDKYVGNRLKARRDFLGISLRELSAKVNIVYQQIQKYEAGKSRIGASMLYKLARILDVEISYFFDGCEKSERNDNNLGSSTTRPSGVMKDLTSHLENISPAMQRNLLKLVKELAEKD